MPSVTMSATSKTGQFSNAIGRRDFLRTAAVGLVGAAFGIGVLGAPVEQTVASEPMVETCEKQDAVSRQ